MGEGCAEASCLVAFQTRRLTGQVPAHPVHLCHLPTHLPGT